MDELTKELNRHYGLDEGDKASSAEIGQMISHLVNSPHGRRFLLLLIERCGGDRSGAMDRSNIVYYRLGQIAIRDWVKNLILDHDAKAFVEMFQKDLQK